MGIEDEGRLSQDAMARKLGCTTAVYQNMENGRSEPDLITLSKIIGMAPEEMNDFFSRIRAQPLAQKPLDIAPRVTDTQRTLTRKLPRTGGREEKLIVPHLKFPRRRAGRTKADQVL
ncbi:MAG: helix-turn-helix domain-containing protein [Terriglobia bacterium]